MINQDRVRKMTRLSIVESNDLEGRIHIASYARGNYLTLQMAVAIIAGTFCYLAVGLLLAATRMDWLNEQISSHGIRITNVQFLMGYVVFMALYLLLSYAVASYKYKDASEKTAEYLKSLNELNALYTQSVSAEDTNAKDGAEQTEDTNEEEDRQS